MNPLKDSESRWVSHFSEKDKISSNGFLASLKRRVANILGTIDVSVVQKKSNQFKIKFNDLFDLHRHS